MIEELRHHIGSSLRVADEITATAVQRLALTLDRDPGELRRGTPIPPGWHGIFCIPTEATSALGVDGLARGKGLIPEIPLPRRMFGGARLEFRAPLCVGDDLVCVSEIADIKQRAGGSGGEMIIVTLRHSFSNAAGVGVIEEQDIVHLSAAPPSAQGAAASAPKKAPHQAEMVQSVTPSPIMLFRFSALTFNSHRIHYDLPYAREGEKLPALMVQGKLLAILSLDLVGRARPSRMPTKFSYRSVRPIFADRPFTLGCAAGEEADTLSVWVADADGALAQTGSAHF